MLLLQRISTAALGLLVVLIIGTLGFHGTTQAPVMDCLYMTVITVSTVGYEEVIQPLPEYALLHKVFTMVLIVSGMGTLVYAVSALTAFIVEGKMTDYIRRSKMDQKIAALTDHIIVCGAGSTGRHIIEELRKAGSSFVVIERGAGNLERLKEDPLILFVEGDATRDETLLAAGIERAAGLITALARDEDNLFVTISGRQLNPKLRIVARGVEDGVGGKLRKAGADSVVFPNHIGGLRLAYEMVRPGVVSFLDTMLRKSDGTVQFTELVVPEGASCADQRLQDTPISRQGALPILALRRPGETHFVYNPSPETPLTSGMVLIVMGEVGQAAKMKELLA